MIFGSSSIIALLAALLLAGAGAGQAPPPNAAQLARARLLQQREAQRFDRPAELQPAAGALAAARRIRVTDLSGSGAIRTFESRVSELCRIKFQVVQATQPSSSPPGSFVRQDPPANTIIECGKAVSVFLAVPPPGVATGPTQPSGAAKPTAPTKSPAPTQPAEATQPAAPAKPSPPKFTVIDLSIPTDRLNFESLVRSGCANRFRVSLPPERSGQPVGAFVRQSPAIGAVIGCGEKVSVYLSSGPPTSPDPNAGGKTGRGPSGAGAVPDQSLLMPDLSDAGTEHRRDVPGTDERPWWPIALGVAALGVISVAAFLRHTLLNPEVVTGAMGFVATSSGDGWPGGSIARIALVSGGAARATPPAPLPIASVEIADV